MPVLLAKLGLALGLVGLALTLGLLPHLERASSARHRRLVWALFAGTRLGLFATLYLVLRLPAPSDVFAYYLPQARAVLAGELVYRDFDSSYGPLFSLLCALLALVDPAGRGIVLVSVMMDGLALALWGRALRLTSLGESAVRRAELLYALSPLAVMSTAMGGQNQSWLSSLLAAATLLALAGKPAWAGLVSSANLLLTKVLAGLWWVPLVYCLPRRSRWRALTAFLLALALPSAVLLAYDANPGPGLLREAKSISSGNLPFSLHLLTGQSVPIWLPPVAFIGLVVWLGPKWRKLDLADGLVLGVITSYLLFFLLSRKAFSAYLLFVSVPLFAYLPSSRGALISWALWQVAHALGPSLHYRWYEGRPVTLSLDDPRSLVLGLSELLMTGGNLAFAKVLFDARGGRSVPRGKPL